MSAVITGLGVVAPTGIGVDEHWRSTLSRQCRIGPASAYGTGNGSAGSRPPVPLAGEVPRFDAGAYVDGRVLVQTDRWTHFALAGTQLALDDAGLEPEREYPFGLSVVTASAQGGNAFGQREIQALWRTGPRAVSAYQSIGWFYAASSGQLSIRHQLKGPCGVLVADDAGGIDALTEAVRLVRRRIDAVVAGGTEAPVSPYALACQRSQPNLSRDADPATAYRPFTPDAGGFVPGEGGAMLIVEERVRACRRGARPYAEIAGTAATHDAYHPTDPAPHCRQLVRAIRQALDRAMCRPEDVDVVFADAAGDPARDALEAAALREVFGPRSVPVAIPKTMTGRLYSGGAPLDVAWAALALRHGIIPPSVNLDGLAGLPPDGMDIVTEPREALVQEALVVARGTGGYNAAAVLRAVGE